MWRKGASRRAFWKRVMLAKEEGHYSIKMWLKHRLRGSPSSESVSSTYWLCDVTKLLYFPRPQSPYFSSGQNDRVIARMK